MKGNADQLETRDVSPSPQSSQLLNSYIHASGILAEFGNETRLRIVFFIAEKERSVGEIAQHVGISQSATSQHLSRLRTKKLVRSRKVAQMTYYSIDDPGVLSLVRAVNELFHLSDMKL